MKNSILVLLLRSFAFLPLVLSRALGRGVGRLIYTLKLTPVHISRVNLKLCYPELSSDAIEQLCQQRMLQLGQAFFETPRVWSSSNAWLQTKILSVEGMDLLQESLAADPGTLLIIPHQGNWEVIGLWLSPQTKMTSLYEPPKIPPLGRWIKSSREKSGATLVPTDVRGVAALIKALKRGETTAILPDQQPGQNSGIVVPFMGVPVPTMTLVTNLINRSGSRALLATALREPGGWRLHFLPVSEELYSEDQITAVSALNQDVARIVALAPEQYQWEYKRFRVQPDGRKIYAKNP
ncbi:lysophospholipid acyltransferase family protein [Porticoccaceae bacterium]|nr:lysophospholipid acyltransferase family protein [Porticoccaceae bacterium]MDC0011193.1 lysophospholipid acyltransferase family protein [Porticoccaceae bacterium]